MASGQKKLQSKVLYKNDDLFKKVTADETINLQSTDLNFQLDEIIMRKLKNKIEGKCIKKLGFILPNSVNIISKSSISIANSNFDGRMSCKVKYSAEICNPAVGQLINCQVGSKDKSQIICYVDIPGSNDKELSEKSPVEIYLFKNYHVGNTEYAALNIGDIVTVRVDGCTYEYLDKQINTIATLISKN